MSVVKNTLMHACLSLLIAACNPYLNRTITAVDGTSTEYFFAYGKYCGEGRPASADNETHSDTLTRLWPPVDDLDAVCYAHDFCYLIIGTDSEKCDGALLSVFADSSPPFVGIDCFNLGQDMANAFFAKYWGEEDTESETRSSRAAHWAIGMPFAILFSVYFYPLKWIAGYPEEGTCNLGETSEPAAAIELFEHNYKRFERSEVDIPVPIVWRLDP